MEEKKFKGFPGGKTGLTRIPDIFILDILPRLESLAEVKVVLFAFWRLDKSEGAFRFLRLKEFSDNASSIDPYESDLQKSQEKLAEALTLACEHQILLKITPSSGTDEPIFFLNSPKGRAAIHAIQEGKWTPEMTIQPSQEALREPQDIFRLYEENIGVITPLIADSLQEAEKTYPKTWIEDAISIATLANKRSWSYINAILKRWQAEGKHERADRRDSEENYRRYIEGEYKDFLQH